MGFEDVKYKKGHKLGEKLINEILKGLGCTDIVDNDYKDNSRSVVVRFNDKKYIPDFVCRINRGRKSVAVE